MQRHVAILGAGPVGLDAALACADAGWPFTLYEAGEKVAAHVRAWGHARLFTSWDLNVSGRMRTHLPGAPTGDDCPTGAELAAHLLDRVAALPALEGLIRYGTRVAAVARTGLLKHEQIGTDTRAAPPSLSCSTPPTARPPPRRTSSWTAPAPTPTPNTLGPGGIPAPGERALAHRITHTNPDTGDPGPWAGTVLLVGAGKSAQTAARDLAALPDTRVHWAVRSTAPDWGAVPGDTLPGRRQLVGASRALADGANDRVTLHTGAHIQALSPDGDRIRASLTTEGGPREISCDHVVALTGYTGDASLYRQLQVHECYSTGAPMNLSASLLGSAGGDCLAQPTAGIDALRNPEPHFFILGAKSYSRLNTFLLRTGYQQIDQITAAYTKGPIPVPGNRSAQ
ncbi:hypothetical protein J7F02_29680 [Streptomyces sp. ISL-112]|uniref:lysine N(6)-hydroxylase/L-ornithine N(5)-oxygenase family protein n=1 Tax=unclassified Streptomyces TaxID=2593676 RepID=UPI001BE6D6A0|nr:MULTISPECIES: lysine N(6)-hydroxylase/L-ornithine N(5)-oxygenase family protein [unclassified Streptomyces]MBT2429662.1 hypothetical protein [Streptomyces sp. ISL-112]MBT2464779.1 hypothetical protein [Streptomyces sp. ISL-63]